MSEVKAATAGQPAPASTAAPKAASAPGPAAQVSTESLTAGLKAILSGKAEPTPSPAPGQEPAPGAEGKSDESLEVQTSGTANSPRSHGEHGEGTGKVEGAEGAEGTGAQEPAGAAEGEEGALDTRWPKSAIDTVTAVRADRRTLKATLAQRDQENEALARRVTELEAQTAAGQRPSPLPAAAASSPEVVELRKQADQHASVSSWAADQLGRLESDGVDAVLTELKAQGVKNVTADAVEAWLTGVKENADGARTKAETKMEIAAEMAERGRQQTSHQLNAEAVKVYPWHLDTKSEKYAVAADVLKRNPWIKQLDGWLYVLGDLVEGRVAREKGKAASGAPAAAAPVTAAPVKRVAASKLPGAAVTVPQLNSQAGPSSSELLAKYKKTGEAKDKEAWMRSTLTGVGAG